MRGGGELSIRRPPVADEYAGEVRAQHRGGFVETPAGLNPIHGGRRGRVGPEPLQHPADFPARFVWADHRTAAHLGAERLIRRLGLPGGAIDGVHQAAPGHGDAIQLREQRDDLAERQAELLVEDHHQGDHLGAQLGRGGAERVRCLPRVPALHSPPARGTPPDVHVELTDDHPGDRQLLLILVRDAGLHDRARTRRALRRQRGLMRLIDRAGDPPTGLGAIPRAGLPPGTFRMLLEGLRKGRGLSKSCASRLVELPFQMVDLLLQALALPLQAGPVLLPLLSFSPQGVALALGAFGPFLPSPFARRVRTLGRLRRFRHAPVMPESPRRYKTR